MASIFSSEYWFSKTETNGTAECSNEWLAIKSKFDIYSEQLLNLTEKMFLFKHSKEDEMNWKGTDS